MKFGIFLLILIMLLAMMGTMIPQGQNETLYITRYHPMIANTILFLGLDNVYQSLLFGIVFITLSINLIMCSTIRLGNIRKGLKREPRLESMNLVETYKLEHVNFENKHFIKDIFHKYGFSNYQKSTIQENLYVSTKNQIGYFGSWLLHLGILLVILFYAYGQITYFSEAVYGIPGTMQEIPGTEYKAKIQDFDIQYREDGSIEQYISQIEMLDDKKNTLTSSTVSVNHPMRFQGYTIYQTSYGWATNCKVEKDGDGLLEDVLYEKTTLKVPDEDIAIYFNKFFPDFAASSRGMVSLSDQLNNPVVLYTLFYNGEIVKMDVIPSGEMIQWNDYRISIEDPQRYTYLDVNKMKGKVGAVIGSIVFIIGLIFVLYFKPKKMLVRLEGDKLYIYQEKCNDNKKQLMQGEG